MDKRLSQILRSINECLDIEIQSDYVTNVSKGLNKAYTYIYENLNECMGEKDLYILNSFIRGEDHPATLSIFSPSGIYRKNSALVVDLPNPPNPSYIPNLMNQVFYLTSKDNEKHSPEEKALISQGAIYGIQPFEDGNKRTGRVMADKILLKEHGRVLRFDNRDKYLDALIETYNNFNEEYQEKKTGMDIGNMDIYKPLKIGLRNLNYDSK